MSLAICQSDARNVRRLSFLNVDPDFDKMEEGMVFRLTYEGPLLGASRDKTRANHKHEIRRTFHPQLRKLWQETHLKDIEDYEGDLPRGMKAPDNRFSRFSGHDVRPRSKGKRLKTLPQRFCRSGYGFVPLVTEDLSVACGLEVLFLRPDSPGQIVKSGDIDNRLKTLFDALRLPMDANELGRYTSPSEDEKPFYCLLEDDRLISKVSIETDTLLQPTSENAGVNDARLVITVSLRPYRSTWTNLMLG
ncbi:MAG TPA: hypothetical protein VGV68_05225 [Terriglobia bacterium]|nr:hypothetical protein [Terriglobia bacterium]